MKTPRNTSKENKRGVDTANPARHKTNRMRQGMIQGLRVKWARVTAKKKQAVKATEMDETRIIEGDMGHKGDEMKGVEGR